MPKGSNPNSHNIKAVNARKTQKERSESASRAGKKSAEVRKAHASFTESLKSQLDEETMNEITAVLIKKAKMGNLKAMELVRDQIGEKPTEKVAVSTVNEDSIDKLKKAIEKRRANE